MMSRKPPIRPAASPELFELVGVWAGAQRLLNIAPSWETVAERLRVYSLLEVLNTVGRLGAILHTSAPSEIELNDRFCDGLFNSEISAALKRRLWLMGRTDRDRGDPPTQYVLFEERSLLTLLQVAVHVCAPQETLGQPLDGIGEALLIINDLVDSTTDNPVGINEMTPDGRRKWIYYLSVFAAKLGTHPVVHLVARTSDLFLSTHPHLVRHQDYISLADLFEEATGLSVEEYTLAIFAFLWQLYKIRLDNVHERNAIFPITMFQTGSLRLAPADADKLFQLVGLPVDTFVSNMKEAYPPGQLRPQYRLPLERSPLVRFRKVAVCPSMSLLESRLTSGIYHILLNARSGKEHREFRERLMRFFGAVFADYVDRTFERIAEQYRSKAKRRNGKTYLTRGYIRESAMQALLASQGGPSAALCDGMLVFGGTVILVESKARMFSLGARSDGGVDDFFERLQEIVLGGARQLSASIDHVMSGRFDGLGVNARAVRRIIPVIISLQEITLNPLLRDWIDAEVSTGGYLTQKRVGRASIVPLQLLGVGDLETLELLVESGTGTPVDLLLAAFQDDFGRDQSFASWAWKRHPKVIRSRARLTYHAARFDALTQRAGVRFSR